MLFIIDGKEYEGYLIDGKEHHPRCQAVDARPCSCDRYKEEE